MPDPLFMLEYLDRVGVDIQRFVDQEALKAEYLRHIYRVDAREKLLDKDGNPKGKAAHPRHLH
ncbi:MAG: hypothetical protein ACR2PT_08070 [Endozoicomonas sp.]